MAYTNGWILLWSSQAFCTAIILIWLPRKKEQVFCFLNPYFRPFVAFLSDVPSRDVIVLWRSESMLPKASPLTLDIWSKTLSSAVFAEDVSKSLSQREQVFYVYIFLFLSSFIGFYCEIFFPAGVSFLQWRWGSQLYPSMQHTTAKVIFLLDKRNLDILGTIAHCRLISITIICFHMHSSLPTIIFHFVSLHGSIFFTIIKSTISIRNFFHLSQVL